MHHNQAPALRTGAAFLLGTALMTSMPLDNDDAVALNPLVSFLKIGTRLSAG